MTQNLSPAVYRRGAVLFVSWSTVKEASTGWIDLKRLIQRCGWQLSMAAWALDADSSYRVQAMVVPSVSPSTKATSEAVATPLTWPSFLKHLRSYEIALKATGLNVYTEEAHIGAEPAL